MYVYIFCCFALLYLLYQQARLLFLHAARLRYLIFQLFQSRQYIHVVLKTVKSKCAERPHQHIVFILVYDSSVVRSDVQRIGGFFDLLGLWVNSQPNWNDESLVLTS